MRFLLDCKRPPTIVITKRLGHIDGEAYLMALDLADNGSELQNRHFKAYLIWKFSACPRTNPSVSIHLSDHHLYHVRRVGHSNYAVLNCNCFQSATLKGQTIAGLCPISPRTVQNCLHKDNLCINGLL